LDDGRTKINADAVREDNLASIIGKTMKWRADRLVYVVPSSGIPYSRLVDTLSRLKTEVPDIHIGVLTGKVRDRFIDRSNWPDLPCEIEWPPGEF